MQASDGQYWMQFNAEGIWKPVFVETIDDVSWVNGLLEKSVPLFCLDDGAFDMETIRKPSADESRLLTYKEISEIRDFSFMWLKTNEIEDWRLSMIMSDGDDESVREIIFYPMGDRLTIDPNSNLDGFLMVMIKEPSPSKPDPRLFEKWRRCDGDPIDAYITNGFSLIDEDHRSAMLYFIESDCFSQAARKVDIWRLEWMRDYVESIGIPEPARSTRFE